MHKSFFFIPIFLKHMSRLLCKSHGLGNYRNFPAHVLAKGCKRQQNRGSFLFVPYVVLWIFGCVISRTFCPSLIQIVRWDVTAHLPTFGMICFCCLLLVW